MFIRVWKSFFYISMVYGIITKGETALICSSSIQSSNVKDCTCIVEGTHFPTVLNLCSLNNDYCRVISKDTSPGKPLITIYRYYIVNLFRKIQSYDLKKNSKRIIQNPPICKERLSSFSTANCPDKSMSCLASKVMYECSDDQQNPVCLESKWNADLYGYFDKWSIRQPSTSDAKALRTATAIIEIRGGPCYYCPIPHDHTASDLMTLIGLICDERITDEAGHFYIGNFPSPSRPTLTFLLNTSHACYDFQPKQNCPEESNVCKVSNTFSCNSANYSFSFPASANHSISKFISPNVEFIFGFCAHDVDCSHRHPTDLRDVLICKKTLDKDGGIATATAVAYYKDIDSKVILRPTGFVWRLKYRDGSLKAVVSFQCDMDKSIYSNNFEMNVYPKPPVLLTMKHRCFCPNPPPQCTGGSAPKTQPIVNPTTKPTKPNDPETILFTVVSVSAIAVIIVGCIVMRYIRHRPHHPPDPPDPPTSSSSNSNPQRIHNSSSNSNPQSSSNSSSNSSPQSQSSNQTSPSASWHSALSSFSAALSIASSLFGRRSPRPKTSSKRKARSVETTFNEPSPDDENAPLLPKKHSTWPSST